MRNKQRKFAQEKLLHKPCPFELLVSRNLKRCLHIHVPLKALLKAVYIELMLCKCTKTVFIPIQPNHIQRWFGIGLKQFRHM